MLRRMTWAAIISSVGDDTLPGSQSLRRVGVSHVSGKHVPRYFAIFCDALLQQDIAVKRAIYIRSIYIRSYSYILLARYTYDL